MTISKSRIALLAALGFAMSLGCAVAVAPQTNLLAASISRTDGGAGGVVYLNQTSGRVSFCVATSNAARFGNPSPAGYCQAIGAVGASSAGYLLNTALNSAVVVNKQSGNVYQCLTYIAGSGTCLLIGNTQAF